MNRVVDLIVQLEGNDPTMPIEVWVDGVEGYHLLRCTAYKVEQITPSRLKELDMPDFRTEPGPLPIVIYAEPV